MAFWASDDRADFPFLPLDDDNQGGWGFAALDNNDQDWWVKEECVNRWDDS